MLLEQNYRSTQNILSAANAVICHNFDRKDKKLWTDVGAGEKIVGFTGYSQHDEAQFVADEIETLRRGGHRLLARWPCSTAPTRRRRALEEIFIRSALPYKIMGGTKFYERAEIKDALAYLIAVANPADEMALRRIMNMPERGIGDVDRDGDLAATPTERADHVPRRARECRRRSASGPRSRRRSRTSTRCSPRPPTHAPRDRRARPPTRSPRACSCSLGKTGYIDALRASRDAQDEARVENLDELVAVDPRVRAATTPRARSSTSSPRSRWSSDADDLDDAIGLGVADDAAHREGPRVRRGVPHRRRRGPLPHRISAGEPGGPAEERRLFYVGITRARKRLYLSLAMTRAQFGEIIVAMPSRFLQEIPAELIDWRQSPGDVNSRGGTQSRALNARRPAAVRRSAAPGRRYGDDLVAEVDRRSSEFAEPDPRAGARQRRPRARAGRPHPARRLRRGTRRRRHRRRREARRARAASTPPGPRSC